MKGRGRGKAVFLAALFLLAAGGLYFYFHIYRVEPAFAEKTYEYGDAVSRDIADYLTGTDWSVHLGELDLSEVDETETGTYEAVVHHGRKQFVYRIVIQDTVPPEILWRDDQVYLATERDYATEDVIAGLRDADREAESFFLEEGDALEEIRFDRTGEYTLEIGGSSWTRRLPSRESAISISSPEAGRTTGRRWRPATTWTEI